MTSTFFQGDPGNWNLYSEYTNISQDFCADMGTIYETGYESYTYNIALTSDEQEQYLRKWGISSYGNIQYLLDSSRSFKFRNVGGNIWINFMPKYSITFNTERSLELYSSAEFDQWFHSLSIDWYKSSNFGCTVTCKYNKELIYKLYQSYHSNCLEFSMWGNFNQKWDWSANLSQYNKSYKRKTILYPDTDSTEVVLLDNRYQIGSLNLNYNFNNAITLRNGLSLTTYTADNIYSQISYFSNLRYEFKKECFLYIGYKTGPDQDQPSVGNNPLGQFSRNNSNVFVKLSLTI